MLILRILHQSPRNCFPTFLVRNVNKNISCSLNAFVPRHCSNKPLPSYVHKLSIKTSPVKINIQTIRSFRLSEPRRVHPAFWFIIKPFLKIGAALTGRGFRKWWQSLPPKKRQYFYQQFKANSKKIGIYSSVILLLSFGYYLSHLEETPITKRRRFMTFTPKQRMEINDFELEMIKEQVRDKILPQNHPETLRVRRIVQRIVKANVDIREMNDKKFDVAVIDSTVENAFVLPVGYVFVYKGMLNLCSNDDQLGIILSHEIAHCILSHGAENVSFTHLLDLVSIVIITAIWAVLPSDVISVLIHWLYQKSLAVLLSLPYNRKIETEADNVGLQLAAKACFDVRESSAFWSKMAFMKETFGDGPDVEFLSTHPSHETRSEYLDSIMSDAIQLRDSCNCPTLKSRDPRNETEKIIKMTKASRQNFFENNPKRIVIKLQK